MATVTQPDWSVRRDEAAPSDGGTMSTAGEVPVLAGFFGDRLSRRRAETEPAMGNAAHGVAPAGPVERWAYRAAAVLFATMLLGAAAAMILMLGAFVALAYLSAKDPASATPHRAVAAAEATTPRTGSRRRAPW